MSAIETRERYQVVMDIKYAIRLNELTANFYRKLKFWLTLTQVTSGAAAISSALQGVPNGLIIAGVLNALSGSVDALLGLTERQFEHSRWREDYCDLLVREPALSAVDLETALREIQKRSHREIGSLRIPAYNDVVRSAGHEGFRQPLRLRERMMRLLA